MFDCLAVKALLQFKWEKFGKRHVEWRALIFIFGVAIMVAMVCILPFIDPAAGLCPTLKDLAEDWYGRVALGLCVPLSLVVVFQFHAEVRQYFMYTRRQERERAATLKKKRKALEMLEKRLEKERGG